MKDAYHLLVQERKTSLFDHNEDHIIDLPPEPCIDWEAINRYSLWTYNLYPESNNEPLTLQELSGVLKFLGYENVSDIISKLDR